MAHCELLNFGSSVRSFNTPPCVLSFFLSFLNYIYFLVPQLVLGLSYFTIHLLLLVRIWTIDFTQRWQLCFCSEELCDSIGPFIFSYLTLFIFFLPWGDVGIEKIDNWEFVFGHWVCLILAYTEQSSISAGGTLLIRFSKKC